MMVFWRAGLAFLAVPKTGTHAYQAALADSADIVIRGPTGAKHMNARKFNRHLRPLLGKGDSKKITTIAVIREPIDWLGSWYRYRKRPKLIGHPNSTDQVTFDEFIRAYLAEDPPPFARLGMQSRFVGDGQGKIAVDHLFDYSNLDQLDRFLEQKIGRQIVAPRMNESPADHLILSPETEQYLRVKRRDDFGLYQSVKS